MPHYTKKPITVEAWQYSGRVLDLPYEVSQHVLRSIENGMCIIRLKAGDVRCEVGDYLIRGVDDEIYPCSKSVFEQTYTPVEE